MNPLLIGILAGLVSALLAAPLAVGSVTPLVYFVSLPIFFATLCWKHQTGLIATCVAGIALGLGTADIIVPLVFVLCFGLPAWGIAYLYLLGRKTADGMKWYPIGHILAWIACISAVLTIILLLVVSGGSYEGYESAIQALANYLEPAMKSFLGPAYDRQIYVDALLTQFLPSQAIWIALVLVLNLWLSARTAMRMKRVARPRPFIAGMRIPPVVIGLALLGLAMSFADGMIELFGLSIRAAAFTVLMLQGLAFIHFASRKVPSRKVSLGFLYAFLAVTSIVGLVLPAYMLVCLGSADILFDIRKKFGPGDSDPAPTSLTDIFK